MDTEKLSEIISKCQCCRIGLNDEGKIYIVPLSFGYTETGGQYIFYFHGAKAGKKISLIEKTHYAGFEMDTGYELLQAQMPCDYSVRGFSVVGDGVVDFVGDSEEKKKALREIMKHNTGTSDWEFPENMLKATCVFKLVVQEISYKEIK